MERCLHLVMEVRTIRMYRFLNRFPVYVRGILIGNAIYTAVSLSSLATTNKAPSKVN